MLSDADKIEIVDRLGLDLYRIVPKRIIVEVLGLVSMQALCERLGVTRSCVDNRIRLGLVPERQLQFSKKWYWTGPEADEIVRTFSERVWKSKVTDDMVRDIWKLWRSGVHQTDIAAQFGLHQSSVHRILARPKPKGL